MVAARALQAFHRGESSPLARAGALLEAEHYANLRAIYAGLSKRKT
jgi:hypothetical protein